MATTASAHDVRATIYEYLEAFERRDLPRCLSFYGDPGNIRFQFSHYSGPEAIARWHQERFEADLRVLEVSDVVVEDDGATVDATVASERLRQWHFDSLGVVLTFQFQEGRIRTLTCTMRATPW
jgi:hypothetical protein